MGQLADRLAVLLAKYGSDPGAHQADLHALAALETSDPKAALERFHELKRAAAVHRRGELLHHLRTLPFLADVPDHDARGMDAKEIEREIRQFTRALILARELDTAAQEARDLATRVGERATPFDAARFARVPFLELATRADEAEAARRRLAREARVAHRAAEARKRAKHLGVLRVEVPDVSAARVPDASDADALLALAEHALAEAQRLEDAHDHAVRALRDPAVARWKGNTRKRLLAEAAAALRARDAEALQHIGREAESARTQAARLAEEATRARRSGRAAPERERKAGDPIDPYG